MICILYIIQLNLTVNVKSNKHDISKYPAKNSTMGHRKQVVLLFAIDCML